MFGAGRREEARTRRNSTMRSRIEGVAMRGEGGDGDGGAAFLRPAPGRLPPELVRGPPRGIC